MDCIEGEGKCFNIQNYPLATALQYSCAVYVRHVVFCLVHYIMISHSIVCGVFKRLGRGISEYGYSIKQWIFSVNFQGSDFDTAIRTNNTIVMCKLRVEFLKLMIIKILRDVYLHVISCAAVAYRIFSKVTFLQQRQRVWFYSGAHFCSRCT